MLRRKERPRPRVPDAPWRTPIIPGGPPGTGNPRRRWVRICPPRAVGGFSMGIGVSIFLIAIGAILAFAVNVTASGIDLTSIGVILMVVGVLGLAMTMLILNGGA